MIVGTVKKTLVHSAAHEMLRQRVTCQHMLQRVGLALDPEAIRAFNSFRYFVERAVVWRYDYSGIKRIRYWPKFSVDLSMEEFVKGIKSPIWKRVVWDKILVQIVSRPRRTR